MEPRSLPLAVLKGLADGTSPATARGADPEVGGAGRIFLARAASPNTVISGRGIIAAILI